MLSNKLIDRVKLLFRKDKELYLYIQETTGYLPHNIEYYRQAMMHRSAHYISGSGKVWHNERLEFLGDAILDAAIGDIVYHHFPGKREGFLTNTRAKIVSRETLNKLAVQIGLDRRIKTGKRIDHKHNSYMCGNAFEALVGALYLDHGYNACMSFLKKHILGEMINIDKLAYKEVNFKSKMIEWAQKNKREVVFNTIEQRKEQDGSPVFHTNVVIDGILGCDGLGYSKKESHQEAARKTLKRLKKDTRFMEMVCSKNDEPQIQAVIDQ